MIAAQLVTRLTIAFCRKSRSSRFASLKCCASSRSDVTSPDARASSTLQVEQVGPRRFADAIEVAGHERVDCVGQRRHDVGELVQRAAHLEPVPLVARLDRRLGEDAIGDGVVELLELVEHREVAVDDDVEQRVQREARCPRRRSDAPAPSGRLNRSIRSGVGVCVVTSQRSPTNTSISIGFRSASSTSSSTA